MAVYGYARVSTAAQAEDGTSLDEQRRRIRAYAEMNGWEVAKVYGDRGVSGGKPLGDRPQGAALLDQAQDGDVVIAAKLDRVFRSASDALAELEKLKARGVSLHLLDLGGDVTSNGIGGMVFTIMSAVAQFERERIGERVREGKAAARAQGRPGSAPAWGFRTNAEGLVERDPQTAPGRDLALMLAAEGLSARKIHARLLEAGYSVSLPTVSKIAKTARAEAA